MPRKTQPTPNDVYGWSRYLRVTDTDPLKIHLMRKRASDPLLLLYCTDPIRDQRSKLTRGPPPNYTDCSVFISNYIVIELFNEILERVN